MFVVVDRKNRVARVSGLTITEASFSMMYPQSQSSRPQRAFMGLGLLIAQSPFACLITARALAVKMARISVSVISAGRFVGSVSRMLPMCFSASSSSGAAAMRRALAHLCSGIGPNSAR